MTTKCIIFSDELEFFLIKSFIVHSIIIPHKSVEKPNTPFPSGGKAIVKRLFFSLVLMLELFHFPDILDFYLCYYDAKGGLKQYKLKYS